MPRPAFRVASNGPNGHHKKWVIAAHQYYPSWGGARTTREPGGAGQKSVGSGYHGVNDPIQRPASFFGHRTTLVSSSHVRSHVMAAVGLAPAAGHPRQAVLVWEGITGGFYLLDENFRVIRSVPVLTQPGARYAFLFAIADPTFPDEGAIPSLDDSGKLMALAAYGDSGDATRRPRRPSTRFSRPTPSTRHRRISSGRHRSTTPGDRRPAADDRFAVHRMGRLQRPGVRP